MADGWLNHEQYQAYGYETIEAADFPRLSARATLTGRSMENAVSPSSLPTGEPPPLRTLPA